MQFAVYRKQGTGEFQRLDTKPIIRNDVAPSDYVDLWLANGAEYTYYVTAIDPLGRQSQPSNEVKVTPKDIVKPMLPQNLAIESGDGVILLSWNMSLELDVEGYNIYRSLGLEQEFSKINTALIPVNLPVYYDSTITNGVQYFYCITAVDANKNESERSNTISAVGEDKTPPDTPKNLRFAIKDRVLTLTWSPVKAKDLAGYYVYRGMTEDIQPKIIHEPYLDTIFVDKGYQSEGMTAGKDFWVSVSAVDRSRNESEKLSLIIEIPDDVPPLPPQGFAANNVDGRYVKITCTGSPSLDVEKYKIMRGKVGGQAIAIAEPGKAPFALNDSAVTKGETMVYYAVALDTAGNSSSPSLIDTLKIKDETPPPSPRNCSAKLTEQGVSLKWERVIDFDLAGYNVYRSTIPTGVYEKVNDEPLQVLEFIDKTGTGKHYYKIKAIDTSGNESTRSEAVNAG
jgi:fibronectin type 3 domain-containing protein